MRTGIAFLAGLCFVAPSAAMAGIVLKVDYSVVADTTQHGEQIVSDEIIFKLFPKYIDAFMHGNQIITNSKSSTLDFYGPANLTSKIRNGKLILIATARTHIITLTVNTDGKSICTATAEVKKLPGAESIVVEYPRAGLIALNSLKIEHVVCNLSNES